MKRESKAESMQTGEERQAKKGQGKTGGEAVKQKVSRKDGKIYI